MFGCPHPHLLTCWTQRWLTRIFVDICKILRSMWYKPLYRKKKTHSVMHAVQVSCSRPNPSCRPFLACDTLLASALKKSARVVISYTCCWCRTCSKIAEFAFYLPCPSRHGVDCFGAADCMNLFRKSNEEKTSNSITWWATVGAMPLMKSW